MTRAALLALALLAPPALADDVPDPYRPGDEVVVIYPFLPELRRAGTGHVRLVYDDRGTAARLNVNEWYAYEEAYARALTDLMMRLPLDRARPLARQAAWNAVVGRGRVEGTIRPVR